MPVILNEPSNTLMRSCEMLDNYGLVEKMIEVKNEVDSPDQSCKRLAYCAFLAITLFSNQQQRLKKPFNPILGETFEYVTDKYRFLSE